VCVQVAAALLLAAGAAGCGGGGGNGGDAGGSQSFSNYELAMQALGRHLGAVIVASGNQNISASPARIVKNLRHVQAELRTTAVKLEQIKPPAKIKTDHELMIRGVREYATELNGVIAEVKRGDKSGALGSISTLKGVRDMTDASHSIAKAGFVILTP
jgi:hypothetical protein